MYTFFTVSLPALKDHKLILVHVGNGSKRANLGFTSTVHLDNE